MYSDRSKKYGNWKWKTLSSMKPDLRGKYYKIGACVQLSDETAIWGYVTEINRKDKCKVEWANGPNDVLANMSNDDWHTVGKLNLLIPDIDSPTKSRKSLQRNQSHSPPSHNPPSEQRNRSHSSPPRPNPPLSPFSSLGSSDKSFKDDSLSSKR